MLTKKEKVRLAKILAEIKSDIREIYRRLDKLEGECCKKQNPIVDARGVFLSDENRN